MRSGCFVVFTEREERREDALRQEDFANLMRQYQNLVFTVCLQFVRDQHTAEDLTQDTFLSAWAKIDGCDPAYYKQWLVRVATNKCKDHLKSAWVRKVEAHEDDTLPEPRGAPPRGTALTAAEPDPQDAYLQQVESTELEELVRTLREPYGKVATMYLLEDKPVAEIAKSLNRPPATVQNQLFRAKVLLRQRITERRQQT